MVQLAYTIGTTVVGVCSGFPGNMIWWVQQQGLSCGGWVGDVGHQLHVYAVPSVFQY